MSIPKRVVTVDAVIFNGRGDLLLIERACEPLGWALPGGVVEENETVEEAVVREVQEETGGIWPEDFRLHMLRVFSAPGRDPRGPTISVAFTGVVADRVHLRAGDDARRAEWVHDWERRTLVFDHMEIAQTAWKASGLKRGPLPSEPDFGDLSDLKISYRQLKTLQDLYGGIGAHKPFDNPTMRVLQRLGLVELQLIEEDEKRKPHWTITEKGRAKISS